MLFFKKSKLKERLRQAGEWQILAEKADRYRRDLIAEKQLTELRKAREELDRAVKEKTGRGEGIDAACKSLEKILRRCGGMFYPRSFWAENVEMFIVVGIIAFGLRSFFFQPFQIPTNSMYPTYHGMTHDLFVNEEELPGPFMRVVRRAALWAKRYELKAPARGELFIPLRNPYEKSRGSLYACENVKGRKWLIFPAVYKKHWFYIGGQKMEIKVPAEFNFDKVLLDRFPEILDTKDKIIRKNGHFILRTGRFFEQGDTVLCFDILSGDALFVDRFSYNFRRPKAGDPFVFRTREIEGLTRLNGGKPDDKYYIKRLAGLEGDVLEIRENNVREFPRDQFKKRQRGALYRNGQKMTAAAAFEKNNLQKGEYEGYTYAGGLSPGS